MVFMSNFDTELNQAEHTIGLRPQLSSQTNRTKMKALCRLAGSYSAAARRIACQTQRPLSVESIKAWTCDPAITRARPCPDWAVKALERNLKRVRKKRDTLSQEATQDVIKMKNDQFSRQTA